MTSEIIGLGCITPPGRVTQRQYWRLAMQIGGLEGEAARLAESVVRGSGIERRFSVLSGNEHPDDDSIDQSFYAARRGDSDLGPGTAARMQEYAAHAPALACRAAEAALADCGDGESIRRSITHLVTVTCTGFAAPGVELGIIERLGLDRKVQRLHIGFMGCHGAINGLRAARGIVESEGSGRATVLMVCVELCTLHMQYSRRADQIVANSLFADGAGAVVVRAVSPAGGSGGASRGRAIRVVSTAAGVFADTREAMTWTIGDHGFVMTLAKEVPGIIRSGLRGWLGAWMDSAGRSLEDLRRAAAWAVHPGGPRVLDAVGEALELGPAAMESSRAVLRDYGNMSSPTVLFILRKILDAAGVAPAGAGGVAVPIVMLAFGPGLAVEGALLEITGKSDFSTGANELASRTP